MKQTVQCRLCSRQPAGRLCNRQPASRLCNRLVFGAVCSTTRLVISLRPVNRLLMNNGRWRLVLCESSCLSLPSRVLLNSSELLFIFLSFANTRLLLNTSRVLTVSCCLKTGILFIDLSSNLLLASLLAAYSNAGMNSEDRNSIYKSRKRPATCLIAGCLQQCWYEQ